MPIALVQAPLRTPIQVALCPPSRLAPKLNPHSARCLAGILLPATSCLGAFLTPDARVRGASHHCRRPKTCTVADISAVSKHPKNLPVACPAIFEKFLNGSVGTLWG